MSAQDPIRVAQALDLDPHGAGRDLRIRCPQGCDAGHKRGDYAATLSRDSGAYYCHRCNAGGTVDYLYEQAQDEGAPQRPTLPLPAAAPARAARPPIQMPEAWDELFRIRSAYRPSIEGWALRRGWGAELAEMLPRCPDVAWAATQDVEGLSDDAQRLRAQGRKWSEARRTHYPRPLLVAVRDAGGVVRAAMRRWDGMAPSRGDQAKSCATGSDLTPCDLRALGDLPRAARVMREGGVVLVVEGEADYLAAWCVMTALGKRCPWRAVIGAPSCGPLYEVGLALCEALDAVPVTVSASGADGEASADARPWAAAVLVPHLGDKGQVGEVKMGALGGLLRSRGIATGTLRLPSVAGVADLSDIVASHGGAAVCELAREVCPQRVELGASGWLDFGDEVVSWSCGDGKPPRPKRLAREVYPVAQARSCDGLLQGVRYRYHDRHGVVAYAVLSSGAWVDKSPASKAATLAGAAGVQIEARSGVEWVMALGRWDGAQRTGARCLTVTARPGWHRDGGVWLYVNGSRIHGTPPRGGWAWAPGRLRGLRDQRGGSLAGWQAGVRELVTTPGLALGLGVALAGALLRPLLAPSFTVHLYGRQGAGKSTTAYVASSVWGGMEEWCTKWSGTGNRIEELAEARSGAVLILDELKLMKDREEVGRTIHRIADGRGRDRLASDSSPLPTRVWSVACLSTGENSLRSWLGELHQGGHAVRGIDVGIDPADPASMCSRDAAHAQAVERLAHEHYGHAGDVWAAHLAGLDAAEWERLRASWDGLCGLLLPQVEGDPEGARILRSLALIGVALGEAKKAGLIDVELAPAEVVEWAIARVTLARGAVASPEERAWAQLLQAWESQPARFPTEREYRSQKAGVVWGVAQTATASEEVRDDDGSVLMQKQITRQTGVICTTLGMMEAWGGCKSAGVEPRAWLAWLAKQGRAEAPLTNTRVGGSSQKWWLITVDGQ